VFEARKSVRGVAFAKGRLLQKFGLRVDLSEQAKTIISSTIMKFCIILHTFQKCKKFEALSKKAQADISVISRDIKQK